MKKILLLILLCLPICIHASSCHLGLDLMSLDSLKGEGFSLRGEAGCQLDDEVSLSLGVGYYQRNNQDLSLSSLRVVLGADCFIYKGLYAGVGIMDLNYLWGLDKPKDNPVLLSQVRFGYRIKALNHLLLDARFILSDPVNANESGADLLFSSFGSYEKYYLSLIASFRFNNIIND